MKRVATLVACAASLVAVAPLMAHVAIASSVPTTTVSSSAAPGEASADQPGEPIVLGLEPLLLIGPAVSGAGDRPEFSWEPVAGAATYALSIIAAAAGEPLWAWQGAGTAVILGGWPTPPIPAAPGPLLMGDATWFVVAFDAQGLPIANSVMRPVVP